MIIMKFGGSSVGSAERIRGVAEIVRNSLSEQPVLVFSALGDTTDDLLEASELALQGAVDLTRIRQFHESIALELGISDCGIDELFAELERLVTGISLIRELTPRTRDYLASFGERLAVRIISAFLSQSGIQTRFFDGWDAGIVSTSEFTNADVLEESYARIAETLLPVLRAGGIPVVTGFIARDSAGAITTLGRGGSDLTASVLGVALRASEIQVWKDVDGILSADPRFVSGAVLLERVSFEEASELAYFGAKILHPRSVLPAMAADIPVRVKNSFNPSAPGTAIVSRLEQPVEGFARAITFKKGVVLVDVVSTRMLGQPGFLAAVFKAFGDAGVSVDVVATSEVSVSLTLDEEPAALDAVVAQLQRFAAVSLRTNRTVLSIVGSPRRSCEGLAIALNALRSNGIGVEMISYGASKVNTALILDDAHAEQAVRLLHERLFSSSSVGGVN